MWTENSYLLAVSKTAGSNKSYLNTTISQLNDSDYRLGSCLMAAAVAGLGIFFTTKSIIVKSGSIIAAIGAFWWAWIGFNYFGTPHDALGNDVSQQALFGTKSSLNSLSDLFNGVGFLALVVALIAGFVINRIGKGIFAFITALGAITGVLIIINLWQTFHAS